jgi:hypothetical protein
VGNHLACIGFDVSDREAFVSLVDTLIDAAHVDAPAAPPDRHVRWTDASGAAVAFHLRGEHMECLTPFFAPDGGLTRWRVRTLGPAIDRECEHCGGADCDVLDERGETITRTTVQWLHSMPYVKWLSVAREFELEVAAFAEEALFVRTEAEFDTAQRELFGSPGLKLARNAFLPEGMFGPDDASVTARATALFVGPVESVEQLTNSASGQPFHHVRIASLPGAVDTVLDGGILEREPAIGDLALVRAWLVGRPVEKPPKPHATLKGWLRR